MPHSTTRLNLVRLALCSSIICSGAALAENSLWLVRPLYPGQEALVERAEKALDKLTPASVRKEVVIGSKELTAALKLKKFEDVPCFTGELRCADPIDKLAASLGFERIVLIQGGQDEAGYKFKVSSYEPATGKTSPASSANQNLEKALLGAIAKVVPVASTLEIKSTPPAATVFIDDVKVGVTPLSTQVLPGERVVKIDLKLHQPIEETVEVPIKGAMVLNKTLEKVAARIMIAASPAGTEISIDGQFVAKDKVDRGILPGPHTIRLTAANHKAFEQTITVKADEQYNLDKSLEAIGGGVVVDPNKPPKEISAVGVQQTPYVQPPPRPLTEGEKFMERKSFLQGHFGVLIMGPDFIGTAVNSSSTGAFDKEVLFSRILTKERPMIGGFIEYSQFGQNFGLQVLGLGFHVPLDKWRFAVDNVRTGGPSQAFPSEVTPTSIYTLTIALLQPAARFAVGRFMFTFQLGVEVFTLYGTGLVDEPNNIFGNAKKEVLSVSLRGSGRANVRIHLVDGFYAVLTGGGGMAFVNFFPGLQSADGFKSTRDIFNSWSYGFSAGVGYAF
jgi:PEGA domain